MQQGLGRSHFFRAPVALHQLPTRPIWKLLSHLKSRMTARQGGTVPHEGMSLGSLQGEGLCGSRGGRGAWALASDTWQTLSLPPFLWAKGSYIWNPISRVSYLATGEAIASLVEGDAGFASRWIQDFVVRSRAWAQPGLMAVSRRCGLRLLGTVCFSRATFLTWLFPGQGAHGSCGTKQQTITLEASQHLDGRAGHVDSLWHRPASKECLL